MSFLRKSLELFSSSFESKSNPVDVPKVDKPNLNTSSESFVTRTPAIEIPPSAQQNRESSWFRMVQITESGSL